MLVSTQWLKEWVDFDFEVNELSHRLTMNGLEVDSAHAVTQCHEKVVVGQVRSIATHPQSDRLSVCQVDVGGEAELQIVCGASNVKEGGKYPVALAGSTIKDQTIEHVEIQSVFSQGMLCSAAELKFEVPEPGIMELDASAPVGFSVNSYLLRDDFVLDIELTPNRADCLSIRGVAREVAIIAKTKINERSKQKIVADSDRRIPVQIMNPEDCPVFCTRVIDNLRSDAVTPDWMKQRLQRVGLRSIHPIVDITNYVMIELGQPMHAFDTDVINGAEIIVRHAQAEEQLVLLDGEVLNLGEGVLLITDRNGPIALAGVMGGESSGIGSQTNKIMLEAAFFTPDAIRKSVARFGLHTDASHRFERGVDPTGQRAAIERATELIIQISGGVPGPIQEINNPQLVQTQHQCHVRHDRVNRVLGVNLSCEEIGSILRSVNQTVTPSEGGWDVTSPTWRFDLSAEHDQIEEVARIYGYDKIPSRTTLQPALYRNLSESSVPQAELHEALHSLGYYEAITYSFVDPELQSKIQPSADSARLSNPIAENLSVMRCSLWPGLVGAFLENYRRSKEYIRLYEIGRVFHRHGETNMLGGLIHGDSTATQWGTEARQVDYFDLKGDLERLFELTGDVDRFKFRLEPIEGLHPWRCASIYRDDSRIGFAGQLHPEILDEVDFRESVYVFEIELNPLLLKNLTNYSKISRYPSVIRDISLVVDMNQPVSELETTIRQFAGNDLESATIFDVYYQLDIGNNFKSVAYRLIYRSNSRTLTDVEIDSSIENVLEQLDNRHNARLRV